MKAKSRVSIGQIRREQVVEAAVAAIHEKGIENLSLSEIEMRTGMSRGQLTYYFRTKEDILLAVFDRMIATMRGRKEDADDNPLSLAHKERGWERMRSFLSLFVLTPPHDPTFHSLTYTFLAQMLHREDFRQRLAGLFDEWRGFIAADAAAELERHPRPAVSARTVSSLIQAIVHGLAVQRNADPAAFDPAEMLELILSLLGSYLRPAEKPEPPPARKPRRKPTRPSEGDPS